MEGQNPEPREGRRRPGRPLPDTGAGGSGAARRSASLPRTQGCACRKHPACRTHPATCTGRWGGGQDGAQGVRDWTGCKKGREKSRPRSSQSPVSGSFPLKIMGVLSQKALIQMGHTYQHLPHWKLKLFQLLIYFKIAIYPSRADTEKYFHEKVFFKTKRAVTRRLALFSAARKLCKTRCDGRRASPTLPHSEWAPESL